ncbi:MAG: hypothetical protein HUU57_08850 [Bdellovibrio sp.]|nr:hypothetical protein [Bdellovibrio sp.]
MKRMMKISLLLLAVLQTSTALAVSSKEKVSCYLTKIDQGYPNDSIPAVGVVEFSLQKIKVPVQFFGHEPKIWEANLKVGKAGTLEGGHFWNIQVFRNDEQKIVRMTMTFEPPSNMGLPNEESTYDADFQCGEFIGRELLSEDQARRLLDEYSVKFSMPGVVFNTVQIHPQADGCNEVTGYTSDRRMCAAGDYAGAVVSIKVCDEKVVRSGFYCNDY